MPPPFLLRHAHHRHAESPQDTVDTSCAVSDRLGAVVPRPVCLWVCVAVGWALAGRGLIAVEYVQRSSRAGPRLD
eukprot:6459532-Prymnesium_polylepis.1